MLATISSVIIGRVLCLERSSLALGGLRRRLLFDLTLRLLVLLGSRHHIELADKLVGLLDI